MHRAHRVAHRSRAGHRVGQRVPGGGPNVPFGGFGAAAWGRENGLEAVGEYTETKAIWVELTGKTRDPFVMG